MIVRTCSESVAVDDRDCRAVCISNVDYQGSRLSSSESSQISQTLTRIPEQRVTHADRTPWEPKYSAGIFSLSNTISVNISLDLEVFHAGSVIIRGCSEGSTPSRVCRICSNSCDAGSPSVTAGQHPPHPRFVRDIPTPSETKLPTSIPGRQMPTPSSPT